MSTSLLERLQVAKFARAVAQMSNGLQEAVVQNGAFASSAAALIRGAAAVHERFAEALLATTSGLRSTSCSVSVQNPAQQCSRWSRRWPCAVATRPAYSRLCGLVARGRCPHGPRVLVAVWLCVCPL